MTNKFQSTLVLSCAVIAGSIAFAVPLQKSIIRVPQSEYLFGISASPAGHALLLYRSAQKPEGESNSGTAVLIKLKTPPEVIPTVASSGLDDLTVPVWSGDGREAYFLTEEGVYGFNNETDVSKLIVPGTLAGLAISPDSTRIAFWNLGSAGPSYTLSVFSLRSNKMIQSWKVLTRFDSDQHGHEIAFSSDGSSVFARTYDEENRTPLRQFEIGSGKTNTIWQDCLGLAEGRKSVYFVGEDHGTIALFEVSVPDLIPRKILAPFHFESLLSSGTHRWIVSINNRAREIAMFNSENDKLTGIKSGCDNATVLGEGEVVCSKGGNLLFEGANQSSRK